jgi:hypothetical protein
MNTPAKAIGAGVAAGAGLFVLVAAGIMLSRRDKNDEVYTDENLGKYIEDGGAMTVAETVGTSLAEERANSKNAWDGVSTYRTPSPSETSDGGESDGSHGSESTTNTTSSRNMETVDL